MSSGATTPLPPVVMYGLCPWDYIRNRPQHLALKMSEYTHVYYVEPPTSVGELMPDLAAMLRHVFRSVVTARSVAPRVTVLATRYRYPFPQTLSLVDRHNRGLFGRAVNSAVRGRGRSASPVLWIMHPAGAGLLDFVDHQAMVYDLVDRHMEFSNQSDARLAEVFAGERRLFAEADAVTATARSLVEYARDSGAHRVEFLPNACDPERFRPAVRAPRKTDDPVIVFVGAIGEWFDIEAIRSVAEELPTARIRIAGPVHDPADSLPALPGNAEYVGSVGFDELAEFLGAADLALIPFKVNSLTASVNPVKLYEYLAAGKPVVSTHLPEVERFGEFVEIAEAGGFGEAARRALAGDDCDKVRRRIGAAEMNSWGRRAADAVALVAEISGTVVERFNGAIAQVPATPCERN